MELLLALSIVLGAFILEFVDSALGMGYGTTLSPVLIIAGFEPSIVIPSILISQAVSSMSAAGFHHMFENVNFHPKSSDSKVVYIVALGGVLATIIAVLIAVNIPAWALKTYIGILVILLGIALISKIEFAFSWNKMVGVAFLSAFNKGFTGGGFGPVVTGGQMISGRRSKNAIGATILAQVPICAVGFLTYLLLKGISDTTLPLLLTIGALLATPIGPFTTSKAESERLGSAVGYLAVVLGVLVLIKTWL